MFLLQGRWLLQRVHRPPRWMAISQVLLLLSLTVVTVAWTPFSSGALQCRRPTIRRQQQQQQTTIIHPGKMLHSSMIPMNMVLDPNDLIQSAALTSAAADAHQYLDSLVSTIMLSSSKAALLSPAHGHSQPLFGPPDPYLTSGRSIAPTSMQALQDMIQSSTTTTTTAPSSPTDGDVAPQLSEGLQSAISNAVSKGWKVLDANQLHSSSQGRGNVLPGFSETRGILPNHEMNVPEETSDSLARQVEWSARFLNVMDKLPSAALFYVVVDFFLLRPARDVMYYKEEVEEDPTRAAVETVSLTAIRVGVFAVIAVVTLMLFGGGGGDGL